MYCTGIPSQTECRETHVRPALLSRARCHCPWSPKETPPHIPLRQTDAGRSTFPFSRWKSFFFHGIPPLGGGTHSELRTLTLVSPPAGMSPSSWATSRTAHARCQLLCFLHSRCRQQLGREPCESLVLFFYNIVVCSFPRKQHRRSLEYASTRIGRNDSLHLRQGDIFDLLVPLVLSMGTGLNDGSAPPMLLTAYSDNQTRTTPRAWIRRKASAVSAGGSVVTLQTTLLPSYRCFIYMLIYKSLFVSYT